MRLLLLLVVLLLQPALAPAQTPERPMTAAEFEAYTEGKTLYFNSGGVPYGVEEYLPGRRVRWSYLDGDCVDGTWYPSGPFICFAYEDTEVGPQCWTFYPSPRGLIARFEDRDTGTELYEAENTSEPMLCLGPRIGV